MQTNFRLALALFGVLVFCPFVSFAQTKTKWDLMDVGPFFSSGSGGTNTALKAISIKVGASNEASVCFDTELLRMSMGWTGGFMKLPKLRAGLEGFPKPNGIPFFTTPAVPGWGKNGSFAEPRKKYLDKIYGSLPKDWGHYKGLYLNGNRTILSYTVGRSDVLEMPGFETISDVPVFSRTFQINSPATSMKLLVCEVTNVTTWTNDKAVFLFSENKTDQKKSTFLAVGVVNAPSKTAFEVENGRVYLKLPGFTFTNIFKVLIASGNKTVWEKFKPIVAHSSAPENLKKLCKGGPERWKETLVTKGVLGKEDGPYVVDTLTLPENNPWNSWIRCSGFDFFSDGRAALCSVSGDVWIVSGIDDKLEKLTWKRYATGLFQPLGLKIVKDKVYVTGRDQITRLHDLNNDGEADYYENFNNDISIGNHYHEFCLNLETDSKGNFYFTKGGNLKEAEIPHQGTLVKVSRNGKKMEIVATGLRAPNGLSIGPNDEITTSDNEGNWVPSSRVNLMHKGGFYGHVFTSHMTNKPTTYENPLFWIPHNNNVDNSSGGQVWVTSKKWGPFYGDLLHTSYGTCSLYHVMSETVDGQPQAGVMKFPLKFESGIMRGRFSKRDGQLYLCGLSVWQSNAAKEGAFHRVRYTGKPVQMPISMHTKHDAIELTFTTPLDSISANDLENYSVEQWNYKWTSDYGSPEFSVANPDQKKHDPVEIKSVKLSTDKKTVTLEIPDLKPVMQMKIKYNIFADNGAPLKQEIFNTINQLPAK